MFFLSMVLESTANIRTFPQWKNRILTSADALPPQVGNGNARADTPGVALFRALVAFYQVRGNPPPTFTFQIAGTVVAEMSAFSADDANKDATAAAFENIIAAMGEAGIEPYSASARLSGFLGGCKRGKLLKYKFKYEPIRRLPQNRPEQVLRPFANELRAAANVRTDPADYRRRRRRQQAEEEEGGEEEEEGEDEEEFY